MDMPSQQDWVIKVQGPYKTKSHTHTQHLLFQLSRIPRDIRALTVIKDTPSDIEWILLGRHFTSIEDLLLRSGRDEEWNDTNFPTHWPLKRLVLKRAGWNVFTTPVVLEGRVEHLVLLLPFGLRFEGPDSSEVWDVIHRSENKPDDSPNIEKAAAIAEEVSKHYRLLNYSGHDETENQPQRVPPKMTKLEILENDAIDTFSRIVVALPRVVLSLSVLNIRSTNDFDFSMDDEEIFLCMLPVLTRLDTLVLTLADVFTEEETIERIYKYLPPNISTLRFRGPTCITESTEWDRWVESFASSEFLPRLKRLSFVLDLYFDPEKVVMYNDLEPAPDHVLQHSQEACKVLHRAAEKRGVVIEPFKERWSRASTQLHPVDRRWIQD